MMLASCTCGKLTSYKASRGDLYLKGLYPHKCPSCGRLNKPYAPSMGKIEKVAKAIKS